MANGLHMMVRSTNENVNSLPFFRGASQAALARAAPAARWFSVEADQLVFDFGDECTDVFLLVSGTLRVSIRTSLGQEMILADIAAGELFGDIAAIDGATRSASVVALCRSRLCRLPAALFLDMTVNDPTLALRLLRMVTARLRREDERLFELAALPVRERLGAEILRLSKPRSGGGSVISPPPSQHVIAARIGARRETISLSLRSLVQEGLIEVSSRAIIVPRPEVLRAFVDARKQGISAIRPQSL